MAASHQRLKLRFEDPEAFAVEYAKNVVQGGAFVPTDDPPPLRQMVVVELELAWCGERASLDAEVVHVVDVPGSSGVAVQFVRPAAALRERFERFLPARSELRGASPAISSDDLEEALSDFSLEDGGPIAGDPSERSIGPDDMLEFDDEPLADRRSAPRDAARVRARLQTTNFTLEGRTRDISEGGVLVSVDGNDVPIGKEVRLELEHPETGEPLEVKGRVARHVEGDGTVAAVGVEFDEPGRATLVSFVRDAQDTERRRAEGGISGVIEELGMTNLIQMFGNSSQRGTLTVSSGGEEGVLAFEAGRLRYACLGSLRGVKAISRMLAWQEGAFAFHSHVDTLDDEGEPETLEAMLLEAVRQIDEVSRLDANELRPGSRLRVDAAALAAQGESLGKTEQAVVDLATAQLSVRRLLDVIPEPDAAVLEAIQALLDRGIVERVE